MKYLPDSMSIPADPPQQSDDPDGLQADRGQREPLGGLQPPQFSLRSLFWAMGSVGVLLAIWQAFGPAVGITLVLALMAIFAHVAGNAIGTRLQENSPANRSGSDSAVPGSRVPRARIPADHYAPVTRLSSRTPLGRPLMIVTALGAGLGGIVGGVLLVALHPAGATPATVTLGCLATAVLAGLWTFWLGGLVQVFCGAWWEAHRQVPPQRRPDDAHGS